METEVTEQLFRENAYQKQCSANVIASAENVIVLDKTVFYPLGGGQPGDTGKIEWPGGSATVIDTRYGEDGMINHLIDDQGQIPAQGATVTAHIDWERRYKHMRMHTALHLLGSILQYGVTGGNISAKKSRLDFDMEDMVDKESVNNQLSKLVAANHQVTCRWISDEELHSQPELVRTMSVQPPKGAGNIRLLEIEGVDLQPCGGTHVRSTAEVGNVRVGKVEKKGRRNRRVSILLDQ